VIAIDPDIPPELQKVFFVCQVHEDDFQWVLNGSALERRGKTISWTPRQENIPSLLRMGMKKF